MQYDQHTVFITHDKLDDKALRALLKTEIKKIKSCSFYVNNVKSYGRGPLGLAFAYISDPSVYNVLIGKNPNGSERVEIRRTAQENKEGKTWAEIVENDVETIEALGPLTQVDSSLTINPAYAFFPEDHFEPNVLCATNIPSDLTKDDLWKAFSHFVPGAFKNGRDSYPRIQINPAKRVAKVRFRENSVDAIFALHMCKSICLKDNVLRFKHAYVTR